MCYSEPRSAPAPSSPASHPQWKIPACKIFRGRKKLNSIQEVFEIKSLKIIKVKKKCYQREVQLFIHLFIIENPV